MRDPPPPIERPPRYRPALSELPLTHGFDFAALLDPPADAPQEFWSAAALRTLDARAASAADRPADGNTRRQRRRVVRAPRPARERCAGARFHGRSARRRPRAAAIRRRHTRAHPQGAHTLRGHLSQGQWHRRKRRRRLDQARRALAGAGHREHHQSHAGLRRRGSGGPSKRRGGRAAGLPHAGARRDCCGLRGGERTAHDVQRAAASFRWTGSWHTVFVTADRTGGAAVDSPFEAALRAHLERFRMAGYDLEVDAPRFVPLDVELHVCVKPGHFRSQVLAAVRDVLSSTHACRRPARPVPPGQLHVRRTGVCEPRGGGCSGRGRRRFRAVGPLREACDPDPAAAGAGCDPDGRLEIAHLANDPNYRDRGRLRLRAGGGQ